jgi:hypothetical protein
MNGFFRGELSEDQAVARLLHGMIGSSMYAAWFRARELRLRGLCVALGVPLQNTNEALLGYDTENSPAGHAGALADAVGQRETPLHTLKAIFGEKNLPNSHSKPKDSWTRNRTISRKAAVRQLTSRGWSLFQCWPDRTTNLRTRPGKGWASSTQNSGRESCSRSMKITSGLFTIATEIGYHTLFVCE